MLTFRKTQDVLVSMFDGDFFKEWQEEMMAFLVVIQLANLVSQSAPIVDENASEELRRKQTHEWIDNNFKCRYIILDRLTPSIYSVVSHFQNARDIWNTLEALYASKRFNPKRRRIIKGQSIEGFNMNDEPKTLTEALSRPDAQFCREVNYDEMSHIIDNMDAILKNYTWELIDDTIHTFPLGYEWSFSRKYNADGSIGKYKARLLAKRFKIKDDLYD